MKRSRHAPGRVARPGLNCDGFFVEPDCDAACCQRRGPFPSEADAKDWARRHAAALETGDHLALLTLSVEADMLRGDT